MFGHVQVTLNEITETEQQRYRSVYCGLCDSLKKQHGSSSRFGLTYDLTFLTLLLTSLYEPDEYVKECRCSAHPCKTHLSVSSAITEYAADMTILLVYHKCLDDWKDDHNLISKSYAAILSKSYRSAKNRWPEQCKIIEICLDELFELEAKHEGQPDAGANCFGKLMESLFIYKEDMWAPALRKLGYNLGRYIYIADAAVDFKTDKKKNRYNPLSGLLFTPDELKPSLMTILGEVSAAFEYLPLIKDADLMRNIIYSGIWTKYDSAMNPDKKRKKYDKRPV